MNALGVRANGVQACMAAVRGVCARVCVQECMAAVMKERAEAQARRV